MLNETQRNAALQRLYTSGEYPSQIVVEALGGLCATCGEAPKCSGGDSWMALQVVAPEGAPTRKQLRQEYRYWQAVVASLDKFDYTLQCYNCAAIVLRRRRMAGKQSAPAERRVYVNVCPISPGELPPVMAWAEAIPVEVFLAFNSEVWRYKPRERVDMPELANASGYVKLKDNVDA